MVTRTKRHLFWVLFFSISLSLEREKERVLAVIVVVVVVVEEEERMCGWREVRGGSCFCFAFQSFY